MHVEDTCVRSLSRSRLDSRGARWQVRDKKRSGFRPFGRGEVWTLSQNERAFILLPPDINKRIVIQETVHLIPQQIHSRICIAGHKTNDQHCLCSLTSGVMRCCENSATIVAPPILALGIPAERSCGQTGSSSYHML